MKTSIQRLPGIRYIGWLDADKLPQNVFLNGIVNQPVAVLTDVHEVGFCDEPDCSVKRTKKGSSSEDTASLKFFTHSVLPICEIRNVGFVVKDVNGGAWLIGSRETPNATVECEMKHGIPGSDEAGFVYTITHVAIRSMVPCIFNE